MKPEELKRQRQLLLEQRELVQSRLRATDEYQLRDAAPDVIGELSFYDNHPADIGTELYERGKDIGLRDADRLQLQAIERALSKLDHGTYGVCDACGQPIAQERLQVLPAANLCVPCKETEELRHPDRMRPAEEAVLYPGYARSDLDETSATYFDGEDAWQAVARYEERPEYEHNPDYGELDDNQGLVDGMDAISNEWYRRNRLS